MREGVASPVTVGIGVRELPYSNPIKNYENDFACERENLFLICLIRTNRGKVLTHRLPSHCTCRAARFVR